MPSPSPDFAAKVVKTPLHHHSMNHPWDRGRHLNTHQSRGNVLVARPLASCQYGGLMPARFAASRSRQSWPSLTIPTAFMKRLRSASVIGSDGAPPSTRFSVERSCANPGVGRRALRLSRDGLATRRLTERNSGVAACLRLLVRSEAVPACALRHAFLRGSIVSVFTVRRGLTELRPDRA
jgi:hypothetical protein